MRAVSLRDAQRERRSAADYARDVNVAAEAKSLEAGVTNVVRKQGLAADVLIREIEAAVATS